MTIEEADVKQVARELGVRCILMGSVRKAGNRIRITAHLIDASTGNHVWADRDDRHLENVLAVQDEIPGEVAGAIGPELMLSEIARTFRKSLPDLTAWKNVVRGHWHFASVSADAT